MRGSTASLNMPVSVSHAITASEVGAILLDADQACPQIIVLKKREDPLQQIFADMATRTKETNHPEE